MVPIYRTFLIGWCLHLLRWAVGVRSFRTVVSCRTRSGLSCLGSTVWTSSARDLCHWACMMDHFTILNSYIYELFSTLVNMNDAPTCRTFIWSSAWDACCIRLACGARVWAVGSRRAKLTLADSSCPGLCPHSACRAGHWETCPTAPMTRWAKEAWEISEPWKQLI